MKKEKYFEIFTISPNLDRIETIKSPMKATYLTPDIYHFPYILPQRISKL